MNLMPQARPQAPRVDVSLEPIACDEPIVPPLFPPLPDRLDLPIASSGGSWLKNGSGEGGGSGASSGPTSFHQGYGHMSVSPRPESIYRPSTTLSPSSPSAPAYQPAGGSFMDPGDGSAGGGMGAPDAGQAPGYYKVRTEPVAGGGTTQNLYQHLNVAPGGTTHNYYTQVPVGNTRDSSGRSAGNSSSSAAGLRQLGNEPRLNEPNTPQGALAPQPVVVTQSSTQDLSLPEDNANYKYSPSGKSSNIGKGMGKMLRKGPLNMVPLGF